MSTLPHSNEKATENAASAILSIQNLVCRRGNRIIFKGFNLHVSPGRHLSILGPSGCGKSTLLRAIAGLDIPESGSISIMGRIVSGPGIHVAPHERSIGFVFQSPSLWPHMTIADNIRFGLHSMGKVQKEERVSYLFQRFSLTALQKRYPDEISGGEARRVSIARSLAPMPGLLLLDEPMTHLDEALKDDALDFLLEEAAISGTTILFVTHDISEAKRVSTDCLHFTEESWILL